MEPHDVGVRTSRRELLALCAAAPVIGMFPAGVAEARPSRRLAVTTVSLRDRIPMAGKPTPGSLALLDAPAFVADKLGLHRLELWSLQFAEQTPDYAARLRQAANKARCRIVNIQLDNGLSNLASPDEAVRGPSVAMTKRWLDTAAILGCESVRANLGAVKSGQPFSVDSAAASFRELADYAAARDQIILTENHLGESRDPAVVARVLGAVDHLHFRAIVDWGNRLPATSTQIIETVRLLSPWLYMVSAKGVAFDAAYRETSYDVPAIVRATEAMGFAGTYSVELFGDTPPGFDSVKAAKAMLAAIGGNLK